MMGNIFNVKVLETDICQSKCWTNFLLQPYRRCCSWPHSWGVWSIGHICRLRLLRDTPRPVSTSCRMPPLYYPQSEAPVECHCCHWYCIYGFSCPISDQINLHVLHFFTTYLHVWIPALTNDYEYHYFSFQ